MLRSCSAVPACAPESSSPFYGLRFNGSWFSPLPRGRVQHPQRETSASRGRGSWFMVQSFREGFNPLSRGPILSRGVQSSLEGFRGSVSSERDGCLARARVYPPRVSGLKMRSFGAPPFQDKSSPLGCLDLLRFFFWCSSLSGQVFPPGAFGPFAVFLKPTAAPARSDWQSLPIAPPF